MEDGFLAAVWAAAVEQDSFPVEAWAAAVEQDGFLAAVWAAAVEQDGFLAAVWAAVEQDGSPVAAWAAVEQDGSPAAVWAVDSYFVRHTSGTAPRDICEPYPQIPDDSCKNSFRAHSALFYAEAAPNLTRIHRCDKITEESEKERTDGI